MAFDAGMVAAVTTELRQRLVGARVEKVQQPEKDEIMLVLHAAGESLRLTVSASANNPKIHISSEIKENPQTPPMFCVMLRKYLGGARIAEIEQFGFERIVRITFDGRDEMGFAKRVKLYHEIMGKYSNLVFTDESDRIIGVIRPVDFSTSQKRQVLPGMYYEMPPSQNKANPLDETEALFLQRVRACGREVITDKFIAETYCGISSLVAREIVCRAAVGGEDAVMRSFFDIIGRIKDKKFEPCLVVDKDGRPCEYSFVKITQYGDAVNTVMYESASALIETYFSSRDRADRTRQRAYDLFKTIHNAIARIEKKRSLQTDELEKAGHKDEYRLKGDLITGSMYMLTCGMKTARITDYSDPEMREVEIELDPRLSPAANAQKWYKKYNKAKKAETELKKQLEESDAELLFLRSELDLLERANGQTELDDIRSELSDYGYGNSSSKKTARNGKKSQSKPLEFRTSGGYRVLCGKNNLQNEYIRQKVASKEDWWFHVKNAPGSHVLLLCGTDEPSEIDFTEAAMIAACHSSLAEAKNITVDYTKVKNLKKPAGSKPGFVIYHTNYSAYVSPDAALCKSLQVSGKQ